MEKNLKPNIECLFVLHSFGENNRDFEILDIHYPINLVEESKEFEFLYNKEKRTEEEENRLKYLIEIIYDSDSLIEMASEDIGKYGEVSEKIHKELWEKNKEERIYCINIKLWYTTNIDYFGEVDTEVNYEYNLSDLETEWQNLDLLSKGSKIYHIDYENSKSSYTIIGLSTVCNNEFQTSGIYYKVHSDKLPMETGYHSIYVELIDNKDSKFFSSEIKAKEAYKEFNINKNKQ